MRTTDLSRAAAAAPWVLATIASAMSTSWKLPVDGAFNDPSKWSSNVPTGGATATFGAVPGGPFVVTVDGSFACFKVQVVSQTFVLDGTASESPSIVAQRIDVNPNPDSGASGSLLVRNVALTGGVVQIVPLGDVTAALTLRDGATLTASSFSQYVRPGIGVDVGDGCSLSSTSASVWKDVTFVVRSGGTVAINEPVELDGTMFVEPNASVSLGGFDGRSENPTLHWVVNGSDATDVAVTEPSTLSGTVVVTFSASDERPPRGTVIPLLSGEFPCIADDMHMDVAQPEDGALIVVADHDGLDLVSPIETPTLSIELASTIGAGLDSRVCVFAQADGTVYDVTRQVTLTSSDERVLAVDGRGLVRGIARGTATLSATLGIAMGESIPVEVVDPSVASPFELAGPVRLAGDCAPGLRALSSSGRYSVFATATANLVAGDVDSSWDVFLFDRDTGELEWISDPSATSLLSHCWMPTISGDGRYVAFVTSDSFEAGPYDAGVGRVILYDRTMRTSELISVSTAGAESNGICAHPVLNGDGRFVLFASKSTNLVDDDLNGAALDVFLRDRLLSTTECVGRLADQSLPADGARIGDLTPDGRFVSYSALPGTGIQTIVFDRTLNVRTVEAVAPTLANVDDGPPVLSDDGRLLAYVGPSVDEGECGSNSGRVRVRDRLTGAVNAPWPYGSESGHTFWPRLSADGRFVFFHGFSKCDVQCYGFFHPRHVWRFDRATGAILNVGERMDMPTVAFPDFRIGLSADARLMHFAAAWSNLVAPPLPFFAPYLRRFGPTNGADIDGSGAVDAADLGLLLDVWGTGSAACDLDGDGVVGPADLAMLLGAWTSDERD